MTGRSATAIVLTGGIAAGALSVAVALAGIPDQTDVGRETIDQAHHVEESVMAQPVGGAPASSAYSEEGRLAPCLDDAAVIHHLDAERTRLGGEMVMLANGLHQAFADEWRRQVDARPVAVSGVFAHLFGAKEAPMVDVIELDARGCVLSRTILSGDDWHFLLSRAAGIEV